MRSRRRSLPLVAIAAVIAVVAILLPSESPPGTPAAAPSNAGSEAPDSQAESGGAAGARSGISVPPQSIEVSGRIVTRDGAPTAARLSITPAAEAGTGEGEGLIVNIDASGLIATAIPHTWTAGTVAAESSDGLRRGVASWSVERNFDRGMVRLGDVVLGLNPVLELELQVEEAVRVAFAAVPAVTFDVVVSPGSAAGGIGPLTVPRQTTIHQFLLADVDQQIASVRIPEDSIDARGVTRVLWRFRRGTISPRRGSRRSRSTHCRSVLGRSCASLAKPCRPGARSRGTAAATVHDRLGLHQEHLLRQLHVRLAGEVPAARSAAGPWIPVGFAVRPEAREALWTAGQPVRLDLDLRGILRVRVVDGSSAPVQRCMLGAGCEWEPPGSNPKRKTDYSPEGRFYALVGQPRPGDMIFVSTPEMPPRLHVCDRAVSWGEEGDYVIDIDAARVARASLRIIGVKRYAGARDARNSSAWSWRH